MCNPLRGFLRGVSLCFIIVVMKKEFRSYNEQIKILENKGLIINNKEHALHTLKHAGYFLLINGYKKPFKQNDGKYKNGTHFEDIEHLYQFDEKLRILTLEHLLSIERRVKSSIAYHFSQDCKGENQYFNVNNYDYNNDVKKIQEINRLVSILIEAYSDNKHSYISHYKKNHDGEIPLWVLINAMTFGQVSKMYSLLKMSTRQKISGDFHLDSDKDMGKILNMITLFRNVCAHNERLYDYSTQTGIDLKYISPYVKNKNYNYERERKRYFGLFYCFQRLVHGREAYAFSEDLKNLIEKADIINNANISPIIIREMGFPEKWTEIFE